MSALICNLPSEEVWVRKEYLTDHQSGHGEFVKGVWISSLSRFLGVLSILRRICLNMRQCMINYL